MKHHTPKRAARERQYKAVCREKLADGLRTCEGCGTGQGRLTFSHRRSYDITLLADPDNIDLMCPDCHEAVEAYQYEKLMNGREILAYVLGKHPELIENANNRKQR